MQLIRNQDDVDRGAAALSAADPDMARALAAVGRAPLRLTGDGFAALLRIVAGQQVSRAAAEGIWSRVAAAGLDREAAVRAASDDDLRAAGLSRAKVRCARAIAEARLDYAALRDASEDEVRAVLTALPGVGPWTAEVYLMFGQGRPDIFAHGDLALCEATRMLLNLPARPAPREMAEIARRWSPWRSVAARILFAYYRVDKGREGL